MEVTFEQLMQAVNDHPEWEVKMDSLQMVGVDRVLWEISQQLNSSTLEQHTDPVAAMQDYFCDGAFSNLVDAVWSGLID